MTSSAVLPGPENTTESPGNDNYCKNKWELKEDVLHRYQHWIWLASIVDGSTEIRPRVTDYG